MGQDTSPASHRRRRRGGWGDDQCWTLARIAEMIQRLFRVSYTVGGVCYLLHRLGWSWQAAVGDRFFLQGLLAKRRRRRP
ncbi:winged helix-turn-helix domain-containing protein [Microbispora sp. NPDC049125]|uniref:helix-turn-helix domain-containing protein n=1 Tax=Microbispora sp. NPDC049125 TaxID=3154929 RepID=UPI003465B7A4